MKLPLAIFTTICILTILRVSIRGFFWKDRKGNKLSFREFIKRWKVGVQGITPLQSTKTQLMGIWITLSGIISGIVINILMQIEGQWIWISVVLLGSLILVLMNFVGTLQKYWKFKLIEEEVKKLQEKNNEN